MASYLDTGIGAATGELRASWAAAEVEDAATDHYSRCTAAPAPSPVVWKVYAVLAVAVGAFLLAVLLMATGVVDAPRT